MTDRLSRRDLLRRSSLLGVAVTGTLLAPVLTACGADSGGGTSSSSGTAGTAPGSSAAAGKPVAGGTLVAGITGTAADMDPGKSNARASINVYDLIFARLIRMDENGKYQPELAMKWEQPDDLTYVFTLVEGAKFHNGETFSSVDVKYTIERIIDPKTASPWASFFAAVDTVTADSPSKVTIKLKKPYAPFLTSVANKSNIVNKKAIESGDPSRKPVGLGPFKLSEFVDNDHITLTKNEDYFIDGEPYLDKVEFRFLPVDTSRVTALKAKQVGWIDAVPLDQLATLKADSSLTYVTSAVAGIPNFVSLNCAKAPFDNKALRQAIAAAVNLPDVLAIAYRGAGEVGSAEVPSGSEFFTTEAPYAKGPNLEVAKQKMAEAGLSGGLTVKCLGLPQYPELLNTGVILRDQLKVIGITVEIEQVQLTDWLTRFAGGDYEMTPTYWASTIDPDDFYSTQLRTKAAGNYGKYSNPALDKLIDEAAATTDGAARRDLYEKIRQIVWDEVPIVFSHYETINYLMNTDVHGSTIVPTLQLNFQKVWRG